MSDDQKTTEAPPAPEQKPARRRGGKGKPVDITGRPVWPAGWQEAVK